MKSLKFDRANAELIQSGQKHITWRISDDKDLAVGDTVIIVDKANSQHARSWQVIGTAEIRSITEKRISDLTVQDKQDHGSFALGGQMVSTLKNYYGAHVNEQTPLKIIDFIFHPGYVQAADDAANLDAPSIEEVKMYADGGSRGNPGPSASGFVILDMADSILVEDGLYLGITTNNQAEYRALKLGLERAQEMGVKKVDVYMDSMLVINQMKGLYKVRNRELLPVHLAIRDIAERFEKITYTHVPRALNKLADSMVNQVLDATDL